MSTDQQRQHTSFDLTQLEIERLQDFLDANVEKPSDLAEQWGIDKSSANQFFALIRAKMGIDKTHQMLILAQRVGAITLTYDPSRGDANIKVMRRDNDAHGHGSKP